MIYDMAKEIPNNVLENFTKFITSDHWLQGTPGGFLSNSPKRKVHAFGNGGYDTTYWTAQTKTNKATLHTKPNPLPDSFKELIPYLKKMFRQSYPDSQITDDTFSIGVCNFYTEPDMYIAAHKDDNVWYPNECKDGNMFASITLYPEGEPDKGYYSRFQIRKDKKWEQIDLPHNSLMIMPGSIEHRVQPFKKRDYDRFKPRINVTFRSVFSKDIDPLMHLMAISNHARYYCIPEAVTFNSDVDEKTKKSIVDTYTSFCKKYNKDFSVFCKDRDRKEEIKKYRLLNYPAFKIRNNMVFEVFETLLNNHSRNKIINNLQEKGYDEKTYKDWDMQNVEQRLEAEISEHKRETIIDILKQKGYDLNTYKDWTLQNLEQRMESLESEIRVEKKEKIIYSFPTEDMVECEFIQRPSKRNKSPYVADVRIVSEDRIAIAHVPSLNLGDKCVKGAKCLMKFARKPNKNKDRVGKDEVSAKYGTPKCELHSCLVEHNGVLVGAHPKLGESIAEALFSVGSKYLPIHFSKITNMEREVSKVANTNMRSDFLLTHEDNSYSLIEVKTVVDSDCDNILQKIESPTALFPWGVKRQKYKDEKVVSARAIKHIDELTQISKKEKTDDRYKVLRTCVLFVVVRGDCVFFKPNEKTCSVFCKYLKIAQENGVILVSHKVSWKTLDSGDIVGIDCGNIPIKL